MYILNAIDIGRFLIEFPMSTGSHVNSAMFAFSRSSSCSSSNTLVWRLAGQPCACSSNRILPRGRDRGSDHRVVRWFGGQLGNRDFYEKFYMIL